MCGPVLSQAACLFISFHLYYNFNLSLLYCHEGGVAYLHIPVATLSPKSPCWSCLSQWLHVHHNDWLHSSLTDSEGETASLVSIFRDLEELIQLLHSFLISLYTVLGLLTCLLLLIFLPIPVLYFLLLLHQITIFSRCSVLWHFLVLSSRSSVVYNNIVQLTGPASGNSVHIFLERTIVFHLLILVCVLIVPVIITTGKETYIPYTLLFLDRLTLGLTCSVQKHSDGVIWFTGLWKRILLESTTRSFYLWKEFCRFCGSFSRGKCRWKEM